MQDSCPVPEGPAGDFPVFRPKNAGLGNQRKFLFIKAKNRPGRALQNVLTVKTGSFGGHLAEKQGGRSKKKTFFSCFFGFWGFCAPQEVEAEDIPPIRPLPKKSCLKTVGFWVSTVSGNIAA
jgi:hypothetical protein